MKSILKFLKEILVVILGVSISFLVDKCKNDRQDEAIIQSLTHNMILDLEKDSIQLYDMLTGSIEAYENVEILYQNIETPERLGDSLFLKTRRISFSSIFVPNNITYEEMKQNGYFKLFKNSKTKRKIFDLYTNDYEDLKVVNSKVADLLDNEIYPYFHKFLPFTKDNQLNHRQQKQLLALFRENYFKNLVKNSLADKKMNVEYYQTTSNKVTELLSLLRKNVK
jgi:hypothetical protein